MNINNIENEIKNLIEGFLTEVDSKDILKSISKKEIEKMFIKHLKINLDDQYNEDFYEIKKKFSGKGNAWIMLDKTSSIWSKLMNTLDIHYHLSLEENKYFLNLKDTFEEKNLAWIRYGGINKKYVVFHVRHKGSKLDEHIKIDLSYKEALNCSMLNGTPHKLGLEKGIADLDNNLKKEKLEMPEGFDINSIGSNIVSLEDLR